MRLCKHHSFYSSGTQLDSCVSRTGGQSHCKMYFYIMKKKTVRYTHKTYTVYVIQS